MGISMTHTVIEDAVYVSLIGPFLGYYAKIKGARNNLEAALMCNTDRRMQSLWCSTYTLEQVEKCIEEFGGQIIEIGELDYDAHALMDHRRAMEAAGMPDKVSVRL